MAAFEVQNGSIMTRATAHMNHKLVHQAVSPSAFNRVSPIEPLLKTLPELTCERCEGIQKGHSATQPCGTQ